MPEPLPDPLAAARLLVGELVAGRPAEWDLKGELPRELLTALGARGALCAQVPARFGGLAATSRANGEFTAYVGSLCSSLRSVMTSQGMAAWAVQRLGTREQRDTHLPRLTGGELAAVAFSEPAAGSDLSAMTTRLRVDGDTVVLDGQKKWITAAHYADLLVVFARYDDGSGEDAAAAVVVPASAPGVRVRRVADPLGCRAAGHADLTFDAVRLPASAVLGGCGQSLQLLVTAALTYGRFSVAWGCVGILRACLDAATRHASAREQFGKPLARHQLVAGHLADLFVAEQSATRASEHASDRWDSGSSDVAMAAVLAKHTAAELAAHGAARAVQVLGSAGAVDGEVVARAYRDAKLMEIIEGSNEICRLLLAQHAVTAANRRP
ncbi:acyl-CoA dehydrogenase [Streptomyces cinnamoneus]|uniref:Acyl-CoA dehydrogenase n=1 Tax=Streptomyces cinnamoneus TaxID=53446 RepID=A0A2G1XPT8_STRCJ|nr:acyl-CoA dehydrogenase family protein [Streptomyces cinnamoneus]PHQ53230.1 acyl-CoA dehydrogenase [Streptomyces cinnamoneus]PPT12322.1 acyl-CoA dehydrogenase [Streptomyces cinnamoneus]